jgi:protein-S-isoprenylcysteine O-methyltransferase Ste14
MRSSGGWRTLRVMSGTGFPGTGLDPHEEPQPKVAGAWVGYLIFALILAFLIVVGAQFADEREWANFTGITVFTLAFLIVPTGGASWLRRSWRARKPRTRL